MKDFYNNFPEMMKNLLETNKELILCLIMFKTEYCGPCKNTMNILQKENAAGQNGFQLAKIDFLEKVKYSLEIPQLFETKCDFVFGTFDSADIQDLDIPLLPYVQQMNSLPIRGYPTFIPFFYHKKQLTALPKYAHLGGLPGIGFLSMYFSSTNLHKIFAEEFKKIIN